MQKYFGFLFLVFAITACDKIETYEPHEEEVITSLVVKLTPQSGGTPAEYLFEDIDGPGGLNPVIDSIFLQANTTYSVEILLLNKTTNPVDTVSIEVEEEAAAHRIYSLVSAANLQVSVTDTDENGVSLGLHSIWQTGAASTGSLNIVLRHYAGNPPNKAENDSVNSTKSSTDLTTADMGGFPLIIQ